MQSNTGPLKDKDRSEHPLLTGRTRCLLLVTNEHVIIEENVKIEKMSKQEKIKR